MKSTEDDKGGGGGKDDNDDDKEASDAAEEAKFNARFHKAMTAREKRFKADLMKDVTATLESTFGAKFDELRKIIVETPEDEDKEEKKGGKLPAEVEAMIRQAQRDAKEAKDAAAKWEKTAIEEKQRASKNEERQELMSHLNGKVKPALVDMVVDQLHSKNIVRDPDTNKILWKDDEGQLLPLKEAVTAWAKSDVGKEFAAPKDVRGTGSRGASATADDNALRTGAMDGEKLASIVLGSIPGQR